MDMATIPQDEINQGWSNSLTEEGVKVEDPETEDELKAILGL